MQRLANKPNVTPYKISLGVLSKSRSIVPITTPRITSTPPKYEINDITSPNIKKARINIDIVYPVLTIALKLDPILLKEARKRISPIATPIIPLIIRMRYSCSMKSGKGSPCKIIKEMNPSTPTIFFRRLICKLFRTLPAISKKITPHDQQSAVKIA